MLAPEQINKAGTKGTPGKLLCLSKSFSRIPMDLTKSQSQNLDHLWRFPALPLLDGKTSECFRRSWVFLLQHRDGIQRVPWSFPPKNSSSTAAQMFSHQGQDSGKAFPALFLRFWVVLGSSAPSGSLGLSPPDFPLSSRGLPRSGRSSWVFRGVHPCSPSIPGSSGSSESSTAQELRVVRHSRFCHSNSIPCPLRQKIPGILEVKAAPGETLPGHIPAASSRSSKISTGKSGFGIPRAGITVNVPVTPGCTRDGDLSWRMRRKRKARVGTVLEHRENGKRTIPSLEIWISQENENRKG